MEDCFKKICSFQNVSTLTRMWIYFVYFDLETGVAWEQEIIDCRTWSLAHFCHFHFWTKLSLWPSCEVTATTMRLPKEQAYVPEKICDAESRTEQSKQALGLLHSDRATLNSVVIQFGVLKIHHNSILTELWPNIPMNLHQR